MAVAHLERAVGLFPNRQEAEQALNELKASGFPMDKVSIIAKDAERDDRLAGAEMSDRIGSQDVRTATGVAADAVTASTLGTILVGLGSLAIPGVGPIIAAGSLGVALVTSVAGAGIEAVAAGGLAKALSNLGIPEEEARGYGDRLLDGDYLVLVDGTDDDIRRAEGIFSNRGISHWGVYNPPQG